MSCLRLKAINHGFPITNKNAEAHSDPTWPAPSHLQLSSLHNRLRSLAHPARIIHQFMIFFPCISPSPSLSCFQSNTKCPSRPVLGLLSPRNLFLTTPGLYPPQWQTYSVSIIIGIFLLFNLDCYSWVHSWLTHNEPLSLCFIFIIYIARAIGWELDVLLIMKAGGNYQTFAPSPLCVCV